MANAGKQMGAGQGGPRGQQHVGLTDPNEALDQDDFQNEIKGENRLQGNDQANVRNERHAVPHARRKTWGILETFRRMDPRRRAGE
ncbi:hypothetical protein [Microbaculum marinum]|uniref:Uncharacterized protein n=1 Tax=Microbaculum marinum TaxID=1764581 RepID=A0AAW9RYD6_9HYPH